MLRKFQLVAILAVFSVSGLNAAWPWEKAPEPAPLNPFEGKGFIEYPSQVGMTTFKFTSDSTGSTRDYNMGGPWILWSESFTYTLRPEKNEIQISYGGPADSYKYSVSGRIITLKNISRTRELVEAPQPFFWAKDWVEAGEGRQAREKEFLENFIAEARRTRGGAATPKPTPAPEAPPPNQITVSEKVVVLPAPTPIQLVEFLATPVDKSMTKFMLKRIATGELRDERVYELKEAAKPGQILSFDGVPAVVLAFLKSKTP